MTPQSATAIERAPKFRPLPIPAKVTSPGEFTDVANARKDAQNTKRTVEEYFAPHVANAHTAWKGLTEARKDAIAPIEEFVRQCDKVMKVYTDEQRRIEEERRREAERKAREEAEAQLAAEAAALEAEGIAEGDEAKLAQAEELISTPVETPVVEVESEVPQVEGVTMVDNWKAEVRDLLSLVKFIAENPAHVNLVKPNDSALKSLARSTKGNLKVAGVRFYNDPTVRSSR